MTLSKRIEETAAKMNQNDAEAALFQICAALDVTATNEYGKSGRSTYKRFVRDYFQLITRIALNGPSIGNLHVAYDHPSLEKSADGTVSVEDVFYHVVRCGLYHEAKLPDDLVFGEEQRISVINGVLTLPSSLIYGLIAAVVVSPSNAGEWISNPLALHVSGFPVPINMLWGKRNELLWLLDVRDELVRIANTRPQDLTIPCT